MHADAQLILSMHFKLRDIELNREDIIGIKMQGIEDQLQLGDPDHQNPHYHHHVLNLSDQSDDHACKRRRWWAPGAKFLENLFPSCTLLHPSLSWS